MGRDDYHKNRGWVLDEYTRFDVYRKSLPDFIEQLQGIIAQATAVGWANFSISTHDWDEGTCMVVHGNRLETEEEYAWRVGDGDKTT